MQKKQEEEKEKENKNIGGRKNKKTIHKKINAFSKENKDNKRKRTTIRK